MNSDADPDSVPDADSDPGLPASPLAVILDTNVFIAAGFRPRSDAAKVMRAVETGSLRMVWHPSTRQETQALLTRIPPLSWSAVTPLFAEDGRWVQELDPDSWGLVQDPDDRKFAALAAASGATLLTLDRHLLDAALGTAVTVRTPGAFVRDHGGL